MHFPKHKTKGTDTGSETTEGSGEEDWILRSKLPDVYPWGDGAVTFTIY